jgi:hypothetical protein
MVAVAVALAVRRSDSRKRRHVALKTVPLTARIAVRSERSSVSHPTLPGLVERVHRVVDRIEILAREKKFGNEPEAARRPGRRRPQIPPRLGGA